MVTSLSPGRGFTRQYRRIGQVTAGLIVGLSLAALVGCATMPATSLYDRIGGADVLEAVVSDTIDELAASADGRRSFDRVRLPRVKRLVTEQFCALSGGPCVYSGDDMRLAHGGLGITEREFAAIVQILRDALARHGVGEREKNELLKLLAPMKRDIVQEDLAQVAHGS